MSSIYEKAFGNENPVKEEEVTAGRGMSESFVHVDNSGFIPTNDDVKIQNSGISGEHLPMYYIQTEKGPNVNDETHPDDIIQIHTDVPSKLKLDRQREKEKKNKRKQQQRVDRVRQRQQAYKMNENIDNQRKISKAAQQVKHAKWQEAQKQALDVIGQLKVYENICAEAVLLINREDFSIDDTSKSTVQGQVNKVLNDVASLKQRWNDITSPMVGKKDRVEQDDYPMFYVIYEDLLQLSIDIVNVLTESGEVLTGMMTSIVSAVSKAIVNSKTEEKTENV